MEKSMSKVTIAVSVPSSMLEFLKALYSFAKPKGSFEEFLGSRLVQGVQADFSDNLSTIIRIEHLKTTYQLNGIAEFKDC